MRDWALLWVISVGFELMELTFQHMLPNFNECWWDSWILDVAVCNFAGMWGGMKVCCGSPFRLQSLNQDWLRMQTLRHDCVSPAPRALL